MTQWMDLVMSMKRKHGCSLTEAMKLAKKVYVKPHKEHHHKKHNKK